MIFLKKNINKFYYGWIKQVINITYKTIFDPYPDTETTYDLRKVKTSIFYEYEKNRFIDINTKMKYESDFTFSEINELIVDRRELQPISLIFDMLNIDINNNIKNEKISEKKLIKILNHKVKTQD